MAETNIICPVCHSSENCHDASIYDSREYIFYCETCNHTWLEDKNDELTEWQRELEKGEFSMFPRSNK